MHLGFCELMLGNAERGREQHRAAATEARASGDERLIALATSNLAHSALEARDFAEARHQFAEAVDVARRLGDKLLLGEFLVAFAAGALAEGDVEAAAPSFQEGLALCRTERRTNSLLQAVEGIAAVALARGAVAGAGRYGCWPRRAACGPISACGARIRRRTTSGIARSRPARAVLGGAA